MTVQRVRARVKGGRCARTYAVLTGQRAAVGSCEGVGKFSDPFLPSTAPTYPLSAELRFLILPVLYCFIYCFFCFALSCVFLSLSHSITSTPMFSFIVSFLLILSSHQTSYHL